MLQLSKQHAFRRTLVPSSMRTFASRVKQPKPTTSAEKNFLPIRTNLRGSALLNTPSLNKGAAFSREERSIFGMDGFLPYDVHTLERQADRAYRQLKKQPTPLLQHVFLASLRDQNQVLFYRLVQDNLKELLGILYTPTAGEAVQNYSELFRRPIGCFISFPNRDGMRAQLEAQLQDINRTADLTSHFQTLEDKIDLVVVTDSEAILGIGDNGVGGITISTSKAALYTLGAGINPNRILPVVLDVGTDNHALFNDPLYMGWKRTRLRGKNYDQFVDQFIRNCRDLFPNAVIHFEDFGMANAYRFMKKYQDEMPMFNDDIQGTGAVALAALVSALKASGDRKLADQRILIYGAGSAGMGIAEQIKDGLVFLDDLTEKEAHDRFWLVDRDGLIVESMGDNLRETQKAYARDDSEIKDWKLENPEQNAARLIDVVRYVKPTVLIGTSTHSRAFNEEIIKEMAKHVERPIIFPMSNPTALCEVDPQDALTWTDGKAFVATGSPFTPVQLPGGREYEVAQTNNALIFPALGLASVLSRSKTISKNMLMAGVHALAELSPALEDTDASLLPDLSEVRKVSVHIAAAVIKQAVEDGNAQDPEAIAAVKGGDMEEMREMIKIRMWDPVYRPLELVD